MKLKDNLVKHLVDSTAQINIANPVLAFLEVSPIVGMTSDTSLNARKIGTALTYLGMGFVYSKGRDTSKKFFSINEKSSEKAKQLHDTLYTLGYCVAISPLFYLAAGSEMSMK